MDKEISCRPLQVKPIAAGPLCRTSIMAGLLLLAAVLACLGPAAMAIEISGPLLTDSVFKVSENPIVVIGDLTIEPGVVATFEAGTVVRFRKISETGDVPTVRADIVVRGTLKVDGTKDMPVRFTSEQTTPAPADWGMILFEDSASDSSYIQWAIIDYGTVGVRCQSANPRIENTTIKKCNSSGIELSDSNANIIGCEVSDIKNPPSTSSSPIGIKIESSVASAPMIRGTLFKGNALGILAGGSNTAVIYQNAFETNVSAIKVDGVSATPTVKGNRFKTNTTTDIEAANSAQVDADFNRWADGTPKKVGTVSTNHALTKDIDRAAKVTSISFRDSAYSAPVTTASLDSLLYIQTDTTGEDSANVNECVVHLKSSVTDTKGIYVILTETGAATNIYRSQAASLKSASSQPSFYIGAANAETVTATSVIDPTKKHQITVGAESPPPGVTLSQPASGDITEDSIVFKWTKYTGPNFASYKVYLWKSAGVSTECFLAKTVSDVNVLTTTVSNLSPSKTYFARVFVFTTSGTKTGSNEVSVTTGAQTDDDKTPPAVPVITTPNVNPITVGVTPYRLKGTCAADTNEILVNMGKTGVTYTAGQTTWEAVVNLKEGSNKIQVTARDDVLNESGPASCVVILDTTPPLTPVITDPNNGNNYVSSEKVITLKGTVDAAAKWVLVNGSTSEVTYTAGGTTFSKVITLAEGPNTIYVTARDAAGNESLPATIVITLDSAPPSSARFTSPNRGNDFITGESPLQLAGKCDPSSEEILVNGSKEGVTYVQGQNTFTFDTTLEEGVNVFVLKAKDSIGNFSEEYVLKIHFYTQVERKWFPESKVGPSGGVETNPDCAAVGERVHVVWHDDKDGNEEIYYISSIDSLESWETAQRLTASSGRSVDPSVAAVASRVYVVWVDERDGNKEIYFKSSIDDGAHWTSDIRLTSNSAVSYDPDIEVDSYGIHVVWVDGRLGDDKIFYISSADGGTTWDEAAPISEEEGNASSPRLLSHENRLHLAWADDRGGFPQIYYCSSGDFGYTWSAPSRVTNTSAVAQAPDLAADGNGVHMVWEDNRQSAAMDIFYTRSADGGASWGEGVNLNTGGGTARAPRIVSDGIRLYAVWHDDSTGAQEIMLATSANVGDTWNSPVAATATGKRSKYPCLYTNRVGAHLFWWDTRESTDDSVGHIYTRSMASYAPVVLINEIQLTDTARIEIVNKSRAAVHFKGWTFKAGSLVYTFPTSYFLTEEAYAVISEGAGADDNDDLYSSLSIPWTQTSGGHCYLTEKSGVPIDFARWGGDITSPPAGTGWAGANPANPPAGSNLGRTYSSGDSDLGSDWTSQTPTLHAENYDTTNNAKLAVSTADSSTDPYPGYWETKLYNGTKVYNSEFATELKGDEVQITLDLGADVIVNRLVNFNDGAFGARSLAIEAAPARAPEFWQPVKSLAPMELTASTVTSDAVTFDDTVCRYLRVTYREFGDPKWFQLAEIEPWGRSSNPASAKIVPVTVSSSPTPWPGYGTSKLIDGLKTYNGDFALKHNGSQVVITLDLATDCTVDRITHYNDGEYGPPSVVLRYAVASAPDSWSTAGNFTNLTRTAGKVNKDELALLRPIVARFLRFEYNEPPPGAWFQLNEIEVYGQGGTPADGQIRPGSVTCSATAWPGYGAGTLYDGVKEYNSDFAADRSGQTVPIVITLDLTDDAAISKIVHYNDGAFGAKAVKIEYATNTNPGAWALLGTFSNLKNAADTANRDEFVFSPVTGRYLKLSYSDFWDARWFQLNEIEVFGSGGAQSSYIKKPFVTAASSMPAFSGYGPDKLYDGAKNFNGDFAAVNNGVPVIIELDMGSDQQIARINHYNDGQYGAKSVKVEFSTLAAPTTWTTVGTWSSLKTITNTPSLDTFDFTPFTGRKIKVTYSDFNDPAYFQLNEIEAYALAPSSEPPPSGEAAARVTAAWQGQPGSGARVTASWDQAVGRGGIDAASPGPEPSGAAKGAPSLRVPILVLADSRNPGGIFTVSWTGARPVERIMVRDAQSLADEALARRCPLIVVPESLEGDCWFLEPLARNGRTVVVVGRNSSTGAAGLQVGASFGEMVEFSRGAILTVDTEQDSINLDLLAGNAVDGWGREGSPLPGPPREYADLLDFLVRQTGQASWGDGAGEMVSRLVEGQFLPEAERFALARAAWKNRTVFAGGGETLDILAGLVEHLLRPDRER